MGTYMRANGSGYGILVMCSSGPSRTWFLRDGTELAFPALVAHLAAYAKKALEAAPWVVDVAVVGIDFH